MLASRVSPVVTWLDVGSPGDDAFTDLFYPPESNTTATFRWMADEAILSIPVERPGSYRVDLNLATVRPEDRRLVVRCESNQYEIDLTSLGADSTPSFVCDARDGEITVQLETVPVRLPNGGRALGVSLLDARVTATDRNDRLAFRFLASLTIFSSAAGALTGCAALSRRYWWTGVVAAGVMLTGWTWLIAQRPDLALSALSSPGGVIALIAGLVAWFLVRQRRNTALALAAAAVIVGFLWEQPLASLVLPGLWIREEIDGIRMLPWLAIIAIAGAAMIGGQPARWLAVAGAAIGVTSIFLTTISAWSIERWLIEVDTPGWPSQSGLAGAIYVFAAFLIVGLALYAARGHDNNLLLYFTIAGAVGIAGLLLWRVQIMRFNGDEPHYYVTARSIGVDQDLELLNNYLEPRYSEWTYSPVGNISVQRDASVIRYAGAVPASQGAWFLIPPLNEGWTIDRDLVGLVEASDPPPLINGPDGALAIPPPLLTATTQTIVVEGPCAIEALAIGNPSSEAMQIRISIQDNQGEIIWETAGQVAGSYQEVAVPTGSGLCDGAGPWAITLRSNQTAFVAQALDHYKGLQILGAELQRDWLFGGLPRDRYGSVNVSSRLLLHNPSAEIVQVTIRLITSSAQTVSEITIGLQPGESIVEPLPVVGAEALAVHVTEEVEIAAGLYGFASGSRYRVPSSPLTPGFRASIPAIPDHDAGAWLTIINPTETPVAGTIEDGKQVQITVCPFCAETILAPSGAAGREIVVVSEEHINLGYALVAYEERTGKLHFDLGLPVIAAPLARFDEPWPVLLITALAGLSLVPGLCLLLQSTGLEQKTAGTAAVIVVMLAPISTYAVRFYTDIIAAALLVWALVLWERSWTSNRALAGMIGIALTLPVLHGRLTLLAVGLVALALWAGFQSNRQRVLRSPQRWTVPVAILGFAVACALGILFFTEYAVALSSRGIGNFFRLTWVLPNTFGMMLDRGSGVLPFAPWVIFALAVPRPLHRTQRAALALAIGYYAMLALRAGGWQTWGAPMRYLLPVIPLVALLAIPGMARFWQSGAFWKRAAITLAVAWSLSATMLLHWIPLAGYINRRVSGNEYLIDDALAWLPFRSPFTFLPTIEALDGPGWGDPAGIAILALYAAAAAWTIWGLVRDQSSGIRD